ncbi:MAG TPA: MFS transporter [Candidatus Binatia bacterium]|nr:MFS transporter [Candidatus Binatia bacterium]
MPAESVLSPRFLRLTAANFCFFLTFTSFFLLPLHIRALGGSDAMAGYVMGTNGVAGLVGILVVGALLDRFDRRLFLRGGLVAMAVLALCFLVVDHVGPLLFLLRALQGVAFAAGFNAASTLAVDFAPPARRGEALGLFGVSTLATHALAPTIGEQLIHLGGFPLLFVVASGYSVVGLAIAWTLPAPVLVQGRSAPLRPTPDLVALLAAVACCGVAFGTVVTFTPTFVHDEHLGPVATFFLSYTVAAIAVRVVAGRLGDRVGYRRVAQPAMLGLAASIAALATVHSVLLLGIVGLVFGAMQGLVFPTLNAFAITNAEPTQIGRLQTFFNGTFNLGVTAGAMLLGNVVDAFGHRSAFLFAAATALLAVVLITAGTHPDRLSS